MSQTEAVALERSTLRSLRAFDRGEASVKVTLNCVLAYEALVNSGKKSYAEQYERVLSEAPWKSCSCCLCRDLGVEIIIFRGTERNKRRGFHNLQVLATKVRAKSRVTKRRQMANVANRKVNDMHGASNA